MISTKLKLPIITALALILIPLSTIARVTYPLNHNWRFYHSTEGSADNAKYVTLPHCWSESAKTTVDQSTVEYIRTIYAPQAWAAKRIFVKFHGVQSNASLVVNGRYVGEHRGGSTAFVFEITDKLRLNNDNDIILRVNAMPNGITLPTSYDHEIYGGISRDVELIVLPRTSFSPDVFGADGIFVTTNSIKSNTVAGSVKLHFTSKVDAERAITLRILDEAGAVKFSKSVAKAKITDGGTLDIPFEIKNAKLWSPLSPNLYRVEAEMTSSESKNNAVNQQNRDTLTTTTGFRTVSVAADGSVKGLLSINNKKHLLQGVSYLHDNPHKGGVATEEIYRRDLALATDMGVNAIRSVTGPHGQELYELCDREGIMVWIDTPLARSQYLSDIAYYPTKGFEANGLQQLKEIIYQNYNHPSVVMWGIFSLLNATDENVIPYVKRLNSSAKEIDSTRPTVALSNKNGDINDLPDLIAWQQDLGWSRGMMSDIKVWQDQLHSRWTNFRSAVAYGGGGRIEHQADRDELSTRKGREADRWLPEARQSRLHEEYSKYLIGDSLFWGVWVNTLFDFRSPRSDYGINSQGVITFDRLTKKDSYYLYRAMWNEDSATLHIVDKRNNYVVDSVVSLRVYASPLKGDAEAAPMLSIDGQETKSMLQIAPSQYIYEGLKVTSESLIEVSHGELRDSVRLIYGSPLRGREY